MLLAVAPATLYSQSLETAPVTGVLVNGTPGGPTPAGVAVLLHLFGLDTESVDTFESTTDADGAFQFNGVPTPPDGGSVALVADYGGAVYRQVLPPDELKKPLSLTVYDPTQDVGVVATTEQTIVIAGVDVATRRMTVLQLLTLENGSDTTLVPDLSAPPVIGQFSFLRFSLPPDATDLDVATDLIGGEVIPVGTGFAITAPVPPGEHEVTFTFSVPYAGDTLAWRDNTLQGAGRFQVVITSELESIKVNGLQSMSSFNADDVWRVVWEANDIAPGAGVDLLLAGLPEPNAFTLIANQVSGLGFWYAVVPALVGLALAGLLVWGIWRRSGAATPDGPAGV